MLITTAGIIVGFGWIAFIAGYVMDYPELGVLGGIIVLGVGAVVAAGTLEERTGKVETAINDNVTETEPTTQPVDTPRRLSIGGIVMLVGGMQVLRSFEQFSRM